MKNKQITTVVTALSIAFLAMTPVLATAKTATAVKSKAKSKYRSKSNVTKAAAAAAVVTAVALPPETLALAERVQVGRFPCELGTSVMLSADPQNPGYFNMQGKNFNYHMIPVTSLTGAVRLEDSKAGAVWLQLGNKSMLMNQKQGIRLADDCMSPKQVSVAQGAAAAPAAPSEATRPAAGQ